MTIPSLSRQATVLLSGLFFGPALIPNAANTLETHKTSYTSSFHSSNILWVLFNFKIQIESHRGEQKILDHMGIGQQSNPICGVTTSDSSPSMHAAKQTFLL